MRLVLCRIRALTRATEVDYEFRSVEEHKIVGSFRLLRSDTADSESNAPAAAMPVAPSVTGTERIDMVRRRQLELGP